MEYNHKICGDCKRLHHAATPMCQCGNKQFLFITNAQKDNLEYTIPFGQIITPESFNKLFIIEDVINETKIVETKEISYPEMQEIIASDEKEDKKENSAYGYHTLYDATTGSNSNKLGTNKEEKVKETKDSIVESKNKSKKK